MIFWFQALTADTMGAFNAGFDTVSLHRITCTQSALAANALYTGASTRPIFGSTLAPFGAIRWVVSVHSSDRGVKVG